jgi:hypothetical protein
MALFVIALLVLAVVGYCQRTASSFDGTWLKTQGPAEMPSELKLRLTKSQFSMRYLEGGGVERITFQLDGREHPLWDVVGLTPPIRRP